MSDLNETSYKQDKTSSQTISLIDESNCYISKQGLTKLKSRLVTGLAARADRLHSATETLLLLKDMIFTMQKQLLLLLFLHVMIVFAL